MLRTQDKRLHLGQRVSDTFLGKAFDLGEETPPVAGYDLWLDAADVSSLIVDSSDRVHAWRDRSASENHALRTDAAALSTLPTYTTRTINGITVVEFVAASNQRLDTTCPNSSRTTTVFVVALIDSLLSSRTLFSATANASNQFVVADISGVGRLITNSEGVAELGRNTNAAVPVGSAFLAVQRLTATTVEQIIDGVSEVDANATTFTAGRVRRIGSASPPAESWDGLIAELVSYPTTLSDPDLALVTAYLRRKWGTP